jgi:hypothetical protein
MGATLRTGIPLALAHAGAAGIGVSAETLMMAAYCRAVFATTGTTKMLVYAVSHNRFLPSMAGVVTSHNQLVPQVVEYDESEPFPVMARRIHAKAFSALKHGCYNPDTVTALKEELNREGPPVDPGYHFNAMIAPGGDPAATLEPSSVKWYTPARATGGAFYMIVRAITAVNILFRVSRPEFDRDTLAACLDSIQDTLTSTVAVTA